MSPAILVAVPLGLTLGLGLWSLAALVPRVSAPRLQRRVAPYLLDVSEGARDLVDARAAEPATAILRLIDPVVTVAVRSFSGVLGDDEQVRRRLRQAGVASTVRAYRLRQLVGFALGVAVGLALAALVIRAGTVPEIVAVVIVVLAAVGGVLVPEQLLARAAKQRQARLAEELPTVLEFLTLALSAGEGISEALRRVSRTGSGELAAELARVVAESRSGVPLGTALHRCADDLALPALTRTIEQLVGALERGAPLAEVLRAQAEDVRSEAKRELLESAGRKEVAMLVPLVFLILPVTVVVALLPATVVLEVGR